jgi:3-oxoadipate enol-lactonase
LPDFVTVPDPVAGLRATGQIRYDLRGTAEPTAEPTVEPTAAWPLVLLGGMTQTLSSWSGQLRPLSRSRRVMAYEARGQGSTTLSVAGVDLARHVEDFAGMVAALGLPTPLDVCGFSFGARVSLAVAATYPRLVRRLVLSGVGTDRGVVGRIIVDGWIAALATGNLEALARISLADVVGPAYLERHASMVESMVETVVQRNSFEGIRALLQQTLRPPEGSPWTPEALASRVRCPSLVMGGALDRLAPPDEVRDLAQRMGGEYRRFEGAGHTIPIEAAAAWRTAVVEFLDA